MEIQPSSKLKLRFVIELNVRGLLADQRLAAFLICVNSDSDANAMTACRN